MANWCVAGRRPCGTADLRFTGIWKSSMTDFSVGREDSGKVAKDRITWTELPGNGTVLSEDKLRAKFEDKNKHTHTY